MNDIEQFLALAAVGGLGYIGKLLYSKDRISLRNLIGAAIIGGSLGTIATLALIWFPNIPFVVVAGLASALATVGHQFFKEVIEAFVFKTTGKDFDVKDDSK